MSLRVLKSVSMIAIIAFVGVAQEVPNTVVERHWFHGDRAFRITLFDNKMAVTTVREKGQQVFFRQLTLGDAEYEIYIRALSEVAGDVRIEDRVALEAIDSGATVSLNLPGMAPSSFSYSPVQVLDLPTATLVAALDDLQLRVTEASPSQEALRLWIPEVGDSVELFVGGIAEVTEVRENGVIVIEQHQTGTILVVPHFERPQVILRVLSE